MKCLKTYMAIAALACAHASHSADIATTPGKLAESLSAVDARETQLTITGSADARDFVALRHLPAGILSLDISALEFKECPLAAPVEGRMYFADGELPPYLFFQSPLQKVALPANMTVIPEGLFSNSDISEVVFPERLTAVSSLAFYGCRSLVRALLPSTVKSVGEKAFAGCVSLTEVTIPEGVELHGGEVFAGTAIKELDASGASLFGDYSLSGMGSLRSAAVNGNAEMGDGVLMADGMLANVSGTPEVIPPLYTAASPNVKVNDVLAGATEAGDYAFAGSHLTNILFSEGIEVLREGAFANCISLKSIDANPVGAHLPEVEESAFSGVTVEDVTLYVTKESYPLWEAHEVWGRFNIVAGPSSAETVMDDSYLRIYGKGNKIIIESATEIGHIIIFSLDGTILERLDCGDCRREIDASSFGNIVVVAVDNSRIKKSQTIYIP